MLYIGHHAWSAGLAILSLLTGQGQSREIMDLPDFVRGKLADMENNHPSATPSGGSLRADSTPLADVLGGVWLLGLLQQFAQLGLRCVAPNPADRPTMELVEQTLHMLVTASTKSYLWHVS